MTVIEYFIDVDAAGNANVKKTPAVTFPPKGTFKFKQNTDKAKFNSNRADTVIRYGATSPFAEPELGPGKDFPVRNAVKGPFVTVTIGDHHFDCGRILRGKFSKWGETRGDDTPVGP